MALIRLWSLRARWRISVVSLLDNIDSVSPMLSIEFGKLCWAAGRRQDVSSLSALTYFRGLRLLSAAYAIRARVPELRMYAGAVCSSAHRSLSSDVARAITAVFGVYEYVVNALPAGPCTYKARTSSQSKSLSPLSWPSSTFRSKHIRIYVLK